MQSFEIQVTINSIDLDMNQLELSSIIYADSFGIAIDTFRENILYKLHRNAIKITSASMSMTNFQNDGIEECVDGIVLYHDILENATISIIGSSLILFNITKD